jgi:beta-lactamase regulating signal transducer with metallopeptidase domain
LELWLQSDVSALLGPELRGVAWVLTYSLHAAVWAAAAALVSKWQLPAAWRHAAWQGALLAPFATTIVSFAIVGALAGKGAAPSLAPTLALVGVREAGARDAKPLHASSSLQLHEATVHRLARVLDILGFGAVGAAGLGLLRFAASALEARRRLRRRRQLRGGRQFQVFQRTRARFALERITLSQSAEIDSPMVVGRNEICVPGTGLSALSDVGLEAVFAHELAHLERGDGIWFPIVGLVEALLWVHPITRRVCAEVRQSAELACDARCVELTGKPRALALALTHIAAKAVTKGAVAVPTMAHPRSGLVARVARLTSAGHAAENAREGRARPMLSLALVALVSIGLNLRVGNARATPSQADKPSDGSELGVDVKVLAARGLALEAELRSLSVASTDFASEQASAVRALEIEQELRHARAMQEWLESRAVDE